MSEQKPKKTVIKVPTVIWALGDPQQFTYSGNVDVTMRPLYHNGVRAGWIQRDHVEALMAALLKADQ